MNLHDDAQILDHRAPHERQRSFLPAAGRTWLLPCYDLFSRLAKVGALHRRAAELAEVAPGETVLDVGCGTGNLAFAVLTAQPDAHVTGLDPDRASLRRAVRKARRRAVSLTLAQGYADRLPAEDGSLDHVVSSLALHHVDEDGRVAFAKDALRALRPGGTVTILDFGDPSPTGHDARHTPHDSSHRHSHGLAHAVRHLSSLVRSRVAQNPHVTRNLGNGLVALLADAGFPDAREVEQVDHRFGRLIFVQASRG